MIPGERRGAVSQIFEKREEREREVREWERSGERESNKIVERVWNGDLAHFLSARKLWLTLGLRQSVLI